MKAILAKKIGMGQIFDENRKVIPVTFLEAGPCKVLQIKTNDVDGYEAVQLGFDPIKEKNIKKSQKGKGYAHIREFHSVSDEASNVGDDVDVSVFEEGEDVRVAGVSKGKGFQGGVKRHGFHGRNATHGVKHEERTIGSVGSTGPQRVIKGKKMPGRMGSDRTTVKNLKIVKIDKDQNVLAIKGAIPGRAGTLIEIRG